MENLLFVHLLKHSYRTVGNGYGNKFAKHQLFVSPLLLRERTEMQHFTSVNYTGDPAASFPFLETHTGVFI